MSAETDLYAALSAAGSVTARVGAAIYPDEVPEEVTLPAIAFARAGTEFLNTIHGATVASRVTLDIWCMDRSRLNADGLAEDVQLAADAAGFIPTGQRAEFDPETETWATVLTVDYWP